MPLPPGKNNQAQVIKGMMSQETAPADHSVLETLEPEVLAQLMAMLGMNPPGAGGEDVEEEVIPPTDSLNTTVYSSSRPAKYPGRIKIR